MAEGNLDVHANARRVASERSHHPAFVIEKRYRDRGHAFDEFLVIGADPVVSDAFEFRQQNFGVGDGFRRVALQRQRAAGAPVKLIYVTANYDNPSGSTLPLNRREELVRLAREHRALVVEDDAYTGIDLDGPPPTSLFAVAGGEGIVRCGTFSKTIATGLRVGWTVASPPLIELLGFMRFDNGASPLLHRTVLAYLESGAHDPHVERLCALYRERRDASAAALHEHCEPYLTFRMPSGGFFHWLKLREGLDAAAVTQAAAEQGVAVTPGTGYYATAGGDDRIRLVYSALPPQELAEAIRRFAVALESVAAREG